MGDTVCIGDKKGFFWRETRYRPSFDCLLHKDFRGWGISENEGMSRVRRGLKSTYWVDAEMYVRFESCRLVLIEKDLTKQIIHYGQEEV